MLPNLKVVAAALEVITEAMLEYMVASEAADVAQKTVVATNATMEAATLVDTVGDEQQDYDVSLLEVRKKDQIFERDRACCFENLHIYA